MKPLLASVVICTRNRAAALSQYALASLARQERRPWEVVVVDDASTDDTPRVAADHRAAFERFTYVRNDTPRGLSYARNLGVRKATGDVIAFMDDDSCAFPNWLSELLKSYEADARVVCVGGISLVGDSDEVYGCDQVILGCNMSFAKAVFARYAFDENLYFNRCSWFDETDLINRLIRHREKVVYNDRAIVRHYCLPGAHRPQSQIGGPLNYLYMTAKKIARREYLSRVWRYVLCGQNVPDVYGCLPESTSWGFCATGCLLRRDSGLALGEKVRILAQALVIIPCKAERTRRAEPRQVGMDL
jgi:glycosyltransferase involved in cell wall biosynthesis